jgi:hypothetical protein
MKEPERTEAAKLMREAYHIAYVGYPPEPWEQATLGEQNGWLVAVDVLEKRLAKRPEQEPQGAPVPLRHVEGNASCLCPACLSKGAPLTSVPSINYKGQRWWHCNGHAYLATDGAALEYTNCDNCGEQFGARLTRPCPRI